MLQPDSFAPTPLRFRGDESEDIIYLAVGRALSRWEEFECEVALIFEALLGSRHHATASRAYGAVVSFSGRRELVMAAAKAYFEYSRRDPRLEASVESFMKLAAKASARRNEIAHGCVEPPLTWLQNGYLLSPARYSRTSALHGGRSYSLRAQDIDMLAAKFVQLSQQAEEICGQILAPPSS